MNKKVSINNMFLAPFDPYRVSQRLEWDGESIIYVVEQENQTDNGIFEQGERWVKVKYYYDRNSEYRSVLGNDIYASYYTSDITRSVDDVEIVYTSIDKSHVEIISTFIEVTSDSTGETLFKEFNNEPEDLEYVMYILTGGYMSLKGCLDETRSGTCYL